MDTSRFDRLTQSVSILLSRRTRRGLLGFLTTLPLVGGLAALFEDEVDAKGRRRRRKKAHKHGRGRRRQHHNKAKPKFNAFGCVDVGKFCKNSGQCCSGICSGKQGKKRCQAHDSDVCQPLQNPICSGDLPPCTTRAGNGGQCLTTTGKAGYCTLGGVCVACKKDADCVAFCGPQAACISCADGTCEGTGGTICATFERSGCH